MAPLTFDLAGSVALVAGGTSGIGLAIAEALLGAGARVAVGSRKPEKVAAAADALGKVRGPQHVHSIALDVADPSSMEGALESCAGKFGRVDILVNSAGVNLKKPTLEITDPEHRFIMEVNYFGPFRACCAFAQRCRTQPPPDPATGGYSIINVCSVTSYLGLVEVTPYSNSKAALLGLTRQLAVEWPSLYGIRVNAIAPGFVPAQQNRKILHGDRARRILEHTPMERFGQPQEIAGAAVYLASPAGRFVNGACIHVDGGFMAQGISNSQPKAP